ncbi:SAV_2336 N-terminal domain-related protein [Streptomyces sp. DSM 44917]|uniref:SAV_2336 N-terminal domain-related protein n=1 Tax=Streptomyces boetiae TaxID=3075541 RepID=A0ABU2L9X7_9ACTN|nr:SAV_2336 N-terminal domain-related protein [Streptomyces sp. DSM 44917]MDT0308307.1 SAV_2336 N-terminal domain-related protein [Streptomyces sp. DSM 44917]
MPEPAARPSPDRLAALIRALRGAGLDPDLGNLADALWLAQYSRPTGAPAEPGPRPLPGSGPDAVPGYQPGPGDPARPDVTEEPRGPSRPGRAPRRQDEVVGLHAETAEMPREALRVGVPEARSLPGLLELERALRPLQRYRPPAAPPARSGRSAPAPALDERETVELTARAGGLLTPAFREDTRGHSEVQLLMDASPAMRVWQRMVGELAEVFARLGAFRDLNVRYLHALPGGEPAVSRRFDPAEAPLNPALRLADPTGRRLTVLVSDCTGPLWRSGEAHRLLHALGRYGPVAVVQPLPGRLWARTRLPVTHGTLLRDEGPAGAARPRFAAEDGPAPPPHPEAVPVPVLPPTPAALGAWARLLAGPGPGSVPAAVGWVRADQPAAPARRAAGPPPRPEARVSRFRAAASPAAGQLAVYLAAAPLFLPVMQLVQRTMLPDSGPAELSEVLLSGLLRRGTEGGAGDGLWYAFAPGVHEELLRRLGHDEALLVLKHCSGYVEQRFGRSGPNFPALALAQLSGEAAPGAAAEAARADTGARRVPRPFAEVAAKVLRRFLPEPPRPVAAAAGPAAHPPAAAVEEARALASRFDAEGKVQHQLDAVRLLRQAAAEQREAGRGTDPELWSELAEQLLRLWRAQRDGELLTEARQAADVAAGHVGALPARIAQARVLHALAGERRDAGDARGALELWRRADREFAAVCATPGLERDAALELTLERIEVLEEQWRLGGDTALLQESVGMVEAMADAWPAGERRPSGLPLAHGRALLRLAGTAPDAERLRVYAAQAAESLRLGCWALDAENAPAAGRALALLDLADALLLTGSEWARAGLDVERALLLAADVPELRAACRARLGRLAVRSFEAGGDPERLEEAAGQFEEAGRLLSRDDPDYGGLIEEWGRALLRRAGLRDGAPFISRAVRVLREARMATPAGDPRMPGRLLLLGRALMVRYRETEELVDLREAEHLFTLAARDAPTPLAAARAWYELGETLRRAYRHRLRRELLERAADAYRRTAAAARDAEPEVTDPEEPVRLAAAALHQRGVVSQEARRPLAARDAYEASLALWHSLPDGEELGAATAARLAALRRER